MKPTTPSLLAALALLAAACSGGDEPAAGLTPATTVVATGTSSIPTVASIPASAAVASSAPSTLANPTTIAGPATTAAPAHPDASAVAPSVIAIDALGPDGSEAALAPKGSLSRNVGAGSGVIVDPSGIAVTAASVVAGASEVTVRVDGRPRLVKATVVGTADCSDVAVIDLDGDGYTPASWATSAAATGDPVAIAARNRGGRFNPADATISGTGVERRADAVIAEQVIEFTAESAPAGAALLNDELDVIGITLPGGRDNRRRALSAGVAQDLIVQLTSDEPPTSVGTVGQIISMDDPSVTGMWVTAVTAGSAASDIGLQAGDVVMSIDGEQVVGGGLQRYCNLMRRARADQRIELAVYRPLPDEILRGTLAVGGEFEATELTTLEPGSAIGADPHDPAESADDGDGIVDDSGTISMVAGPAWDDVDGGTWLDTGNPSLRVAPDLDRFGSHWGNPGVVVTTDTDAWERLGGNIGAYLVEQLGIFDAETCPHDDQIEADNEHYVGAFVLRSCPDGTTLLQGAYATTDGGGTMVYVEATYLDANDRAILADVLTTVVTE